MRQGRVVEQRAPVEVGAFAARGQFEPAADQFAALDQGDDLRELPAGHLAKKFDGGRIPG
jgi:hypothetical protein